MLKCRHAAFSDQITVVAFSDASDAVTVTLSPRGGSDTITMTTEAGGDRTSPATDGESRVGYIGNVTITGLDSFTEYTYTADNGTDTFSGAFTTLPVRNGGAKYSLSFGTCLWYQSGATTSAYEFLDWYRQNETEYPLIGHIMPDDVCYCDTPQGFDNGEKVYDDDASLPTFTDSGSVKISEYNASLHYGVFYGGLTGTNLTIEDSDMYNYLSNVSFYPQAGDHEYFNNIWTSENLGTVPNPLHHTAGNYDGKWRIAWNNFMKPLCGELFASANTDSHHWSLDCGDLQIIAPDCVSNTAASGGSITSALGTDQITEILNKVDNDIPLKIFANPAFSLHPGGVDRYKSEQYLESEHHRLVLDDGTDGTPNSLMNNPNTNGNIGCHIWFRGDSHGQVCYKLTGAASGQNLAESFYEVGLSGMNGGRAGSDTPFNPNDLSESLNTGIEYVGGMGNVSTWHKTCVIVRVDGTTNPPSMEVRRYDYNWAGTATADVLDKTFVLEDNIGPNSEWALTFKKVFAPFQGTNLGHDSLSGVRTLRGVDGAGADE